MIRHVESRQPLLPVLLEAGWLLIAILVPLWINLWVSQPFDAAKIALLRWLVWVMAALWVGDMLLRPRSLRAELPSPAILLPLCAFGVTAVISTMAASNAGLSLWGSHHRAYGLLTLGSYLLLSIIVAARLRAPDQVRRLLGAMVATSIPMLLLSILQVMGQDPLHLVSDARSPIYATLGRANFAGAYLAMLLPLTLALGLITPGRLLRNGLFLLAVAQTVVIGLTLARAAWLAAMAGLLLLAAGRLWLHFNRRGRQWLACTGGLLLAGSVVGASSVFLLADGGSIAARRTIWRATLTLIGERPVLGYGLDSLALHFARVFPPELVYYQGREVFVDRAHNWLLDTTVALGILGTAAILWLWAIVFWWGWRSVQRLHAQGERTPSWLLLACLCAIGANLAGNLFGFDVAATATATWLLLAVVISLGCAGEHVESAVPARHGPTWRWAVAGVLLALALWGGWWGNGRFLLADMAYQSSLQAGTQGEWDRAAGAARQSVTRWPQEPAYWEQLAQVEGAQKQFDAAGTAWEQALARRPGDPAIWTRMGQFYLDAARTGREDALSQAEEAFAHAAALAPNHARLYVAWGRLYLFTQEWHAAAQRFEKAVDLDATDALAWRLLADTYMMQGKTALAVDARQEAERWANSTE